MSASMFMLKLGSCEEENFVVSREKYKWKIIEERFVYIFFPSLHSGWLNGKAFGREREADFLRGKVFLPPSEWRVEFVMLFLCD